MKLNSQNTNLNLRHLRALHAVAEAGSFARAADQLGIVPSALSEVIRQLEESAGIALFDRRMRPPELTPEGREFLRDTLPVMGALDKALLRLQESGALARGRLHLGATPSTISHWIAPAIRQFRRDHPGLTLWIHDGPADQLAEMVAQGDLDLAVAGYSGKSPLLDLSEIARDPVGLAVPVGHRLAGRKRVRLADIDPAELIHLEPGAGTAQLLDSHAGLPSEFRSGPFRVQSTFGQLCLIRSGVGIGLLPQNAVTLFDDPRLRFLPVDGLVLERRISLITPARRPISHPARRFIEALDQHIGWPGER